MIRKREEKEIRRLLEFLSDKERRLDEVLFKKDEKRYYPLSMSPDNDNLNTNISFHTQNNPKFIVNNDENIPKLVNASTPADVQKLNLDNSYYPTLIILSTMLIGIISIILTYTKYGSLYNSISLFSYLLIISPMVIFLMVGYLINKLERTNGMKFSLFTRIVISSLIPGGGLVVKGKNVSGLIIYLFATFLFSLTLFFKQDFFWPLNLFGGIKEALFLCFVFSIVGFSCSLIFSIFYTYTASVKPKFNGFRFLLLLLLFLSGIEALIYSDSLFYFNEIDKVLKFTHNEHLDKTFLVISNIKSALQFFFYS